MFVLHTFSHWDSRASQQLWDTLPGMYELDRDKHHHMLIRGQNFASGDIVCPKWGMSKIRSRPSMDPAYQTELLQTSEFSLHRYTDSRRVQGG